MIKYISAHLLLFLLFHTLSHAQTVGLFENDAEAFNGYTFFSGSANTDTYLIDNCGRLVHSWAGDLLPGSANYLLENGDLLRAVRIGSTTFLGGGIGGRIEQVNWEGDLVWAYNYATTEVHHHHDMAYLPNGNVLILAWERIAQEEAIDNGRDPSLVGAFLWPDHIIEIQPDGSSGGTIVWEWHFWDHLIQDFDATKLNYGVVSDHPELLDVNYTGFDPASANADWLHCNSINYNADRDEIIISSRHLNEFYIIDHSTTTAEAAGHTGGNAGKGGDFLYRWGNPESYNRGEMNDKKSFGQHDVHWIEEGLPDEGKIMFFNNGIGRPGGSHSTVDIIEPPLDSEGNYKLEAGEPHGPSDLFWSYQSDPADEFYSSNISGAQQQPNGNILICEGALGHLFEVDVAGNTHWDYLSPVGVGGPIAQGDNPVFTAVFRAYRYPPDYPAFDGKDLTPGDLLELDPLPFDCMLTVPANEAEALDENIRIFPNPFEDYIIVSSDYYLQGKINIINAQGQQVYSTFVKSNEIRINTKRFGAGMYLLELPNHSFVKLICYP